MICYNASSPYKLLLKNIHAFFISSQFADMFVPIPVGGTVYFADSNAIEVSTLYTCMCVV